MGLDPDHVVALGAAVQAALVANAPARDDVVIADVAAFTLGVDNVYRIGLGYREGYFAPIIECNSIIPVSRDQTFSTVQLGQEALRFGIYQGESPLIKNNPRLREVTVKVPRNKMAHESATVRFTHLVSGLLKVEVSAVSTGLKSNLVVTQLAGEMAEVDMKATLKKMVALKVRPREDAANIHLRTRLAAAYAMSRADARDQATHLLVQFDTALDAQDKAALAALPTELHKTLDEFAAQYVT